MAATFVIVKWKLRRPDGFENNEVVRHRPPVSRVAPQLFRGQPLTILLHVVRESASGWVGAIRDVAREVSL
jgi:hypothetical protein